MSNNKFRRLDLLKRSKKEKVVKRVERVPELKLMGLVKKKEDGKGKVSHQMKINSLGVNALGLKGGDKISILQREDNTFLIAKVTGEKEGRTLSTNKNTEALSLTFSNAHNLMKEISNSFEITEKTVSKDDVEEEDMKAMMGDYAWHILMPLSSTVTETIPVEIVKEENKVEEKVVKVSDDF